VSRHAIDVPRDGKHVQFLDCRIIDDRKRTSSAKFVMERIRIIEVGVACSACAATLKGVTDLKACGIAKAMP
jgi:hypothetical protein